MSASQPAIPHCPGGGGPDGSAPIFVPKGKTVSFALHLLHRRKDLWGPDANHFRPERWENRKMEWLGGSDEPAKTITFTMQPRDGVPVRLSYAKLESY